MNDFHLATSILNPETIRTLSTRNDAKKNNFSEDHTIHILNQSWQLQPPVEWLMDKGKNINWREIFKRKRQFPPDTDSNYIRELNRHQFLFEFTKRYITSHDIEWLKFIQTITESWIHENDEHNLYLSPLDTALRLMSWRINLDIFENIKLFEYSYYHKLFSEYTSQLEYLNNKFSQVSRLKNYEDIAIAASIFINTFSFMTDKKMQHAHRRARRYLEKAVRQQVAEEGVSREESSWFHRFVTECFLISYIVGKKKKEMFSEVYQDRLQAMLNYLVTLQQPDGRFCDYGESNLIRFVRTSSAIHPWDARGILAAGAILFQRTDFAHSGEFNEETLWLLGAEGKEIIQKMKQQSKTPTRIFNMFHGMRHCTIQNNGDFLFTRSGEFGIGGEGSCSNSHCDLTSPILWIQKRPILIDSGTYSQRRLYDLGVYFRTAPAHNVLLINGADQAELKRTAGWKKIPTKNRLILDDLDDQLIISATHNAYERFEAIYGRKIIYSKIDTHIQIIDRIILKKVGRLDWYFHFSPGYRFELEENTLLLYQENAQVLDMHLPQTKEVWLEKRWHAVNYGVRDEHICLRLSHQMDPGIMEYKFDLRSLA